ncbi:hypothetical protein SNE40_004543 [Patella caerulea]|uniref:snRNA-activating protein complex subunit 3 n=1 Tax=Patella caerulea TaxID=87958 RepID=A0AAN8KC46_PATCE
MTDSKSDNEQDSTNLINIQEFLEKWSQIEDFTKKALEKKESPLEQIAQDIDLPVQTVSDLSAVCSLETLLCGSEPEDKKLYYQVIPETDLKTLYYQSQDLQRRKESFFYKNSVLKSMKYNVNDTVHNPKLQNRATIPPEKQVPTPNVVLSINIHRPYNFKSTQPMVDQKILVRGDMFLTEFRDAIDCVNNLAVAGDFSENLAAAQVAPTCGETFKSGFLYIEGTFYNDFRHDDNRDYSKPIIEWMKNSNNCGTTHKTTAMESVRFRDLTVKLGEPYLYMHQGNCEHIISFTDVRMLIADDPQSIDDYPFVVRQVSRRRVLCRSCMMYTARWQVEESVFTPVEPCYLCDGCLTSLHYDEDGNKIGHFKAFKFADTSSVQC